MARIIIIHPDDPQQRLVKIVVDLLKSGGVIAYPTDSAYALGCQLSDKKAAERIMKIRMLRKDHKFTLICRDLSHIASYAKVDNTTYRLLKAHTPGPYTFVLPASREVPKRLQSPKRKTIGLRIPDNRIVQAILEEFGEPIMSVTLKMPDEDLPLTDPEIIAERLESQIAAVVDGGLCGFEPTSVIDLTNGSEVLRKGKGDIRAFS